MELDVVGYLAFPRVFAHDYFAGYEKLKWIGSIGLFLKLLEFLRKKN